MIGNEAYWPMDNQELECPFLFFFFFSSEILALFLIGSG